MVLQELLFALLGITGDVFVDGEADETGERLLVVAPDVPLGLPEREALNRLVRLRAATPAAAYARAPARAAGAGPPLPGA